MSDKTTTRPPQSTHRRALNDLRRIRDEIRLKLHLGGMDARTAWAELEPQIEHVERVLTNAGHSIGREMDAGIAAVKRAAETLRARLMSQTDHAPRP